MPSFGSLFSGIGGMDLGLEKAGGKVQWQVEINSYCQRILERRWPFVLRFKNVCTTYNLPYVDLICGGFPCQDISSARTSNIRRGLDGEQSGLWREFARIVGECRPRWVLVENSPRWRSWVPNVRSDLGRFGYASVPLVVSAGFVGAPHSRPRAFVVADANGTSQSLRAFHEKASSLLPLAESFWYKPPNFDNSVYMDDGAAGRMDQLRGLGNAVVPQVAELIGRLLWT